MAVVDDRACSAAYALAAACDMVYVSRTACVGSVGVVAYHEDRSAADSMAGVRIEYVYAGKHKIDANPHEPLTDQARVAVQAEVDRLYDLFAETVAACRGLSVDAVRATEAGIYFGADAITAGLADRIGTISDAIAGLTEPGGMLDPPDLDDPEPVPDTPDESGQPIKAEAQEITIASEPPVAGLVSEAADIVEACAAAGVADLAATHIRAGRPLAEVLALLAPAADIRVACAAAGMDDLAGEYIRRGVPIAVVREQLLAARAAEGPTRIESHVLPTSVTTAKLPPAASIYAAYNQQRQAK